MRQFRWTTLFLAFWTLYFAVFWSRALVSNDSGGVTAAHVNIWGDWAIHFTMGSAMAYRELFLLESPLLINAPFAYPFFVNFTSALLVRSGVSFFSAFTIPSFVFSVSLVAVLLWFYAVTLKSRRTAVAAATIFLLNGGFGFVDSLRSAFGSSSPLSRLFLPAVRSTSNEAAGIYWINVIESMVIPQRAFQLGFPWALAVLTLIYRSRKPWVPDKSNERRSFPPIMTSVAIGLALGLLPVVHAHAFAACGLILLCWSVADIATARGLRLRTLGWWSIVAVSALMMAVPLWTLYFSGLDSASAVRWSPGWYASNLDFDWIVFWLKNWGLVPLVALAGLLLCWAPGTSSDRVRTGLFFAPFVIMFVLPNLFAFHRWMWDNTKILVWSSVGFSALAAIALRRLWSAERNRTVLRAATVCLFFVMTASGAWDVYRIQVPSLNKHDMYSDQDLFLTEWVKMNTAPDSLWLTGNYHNHWLFNLTGRRSVMTFPGWLWTHGYDYTTIERDVRSMYAFPEKEEIFRRYGVDYVVVGPQEPRQFKVDIDGFRRRFKTVVRTESNEIFRTSLGDPAVSSSSRPDVLQPTLPLSATLKPGLVRATYKGRYFLGKPHIDRGATDLNFQYDAPDEKPFTVPVSIEWSGFFKVPNAATYRFKLRSDDGAVMSLNDVSLINNDGIHAVQEATASVRLSEGYHWFKLRYFDTGGGAILSVGWSTSETNATSFDFDALYH